MKRFHFSLERVLRLKRQQETLAEWRLQQAQAKVRAAEAEVAALRGELGRVGSAPGPAEVGREFRWGGWAARRDLAAHLADALATAEAAAEKARAQAEEAVAAWQHCHREVEALLTLRRRQEELHAAEVGRQEQFERDEHGLLRWRKSETNGSQS